jgi:hypothetical protein
MTRSELLAAVGDVGTMRALVALLSDADIGYLMPNGSVSPSSLTWARGGPAEKTLTFALVAPGKIDVEYDDLTTGISDTDSFMVADAPAQATVDQWFATYFASDG